MNITLSPRLAACCGLVAPGDRVADIGCDHGYLSIYLLTKGIASAVIASDIRPMPLQSAVSNAEKYGVRDRIQFFLSDGAQSIPRDFDTLVCAGMGADTMVSILQNAPWLRDYRYRLILQCQSKTHFLRKFLSDNGWRITEETVVRDGRFLYTVMEVYYEPGNTLSPGQWYFPPALLENPGPETKEYYRRVTDNLRKAIEGQKENAPQEYVDALRELENLPPELDFLKEA